MHHVSSTANAVTVAILAAVLVLYGCGGAEDGAPARTASFGEPTPSAPSTPSAPDTTVPTTPTGLAANATSPSQINLTWTASSDNVAVTGYRVYRGGVFLSTVGAAVVTYSDSGLTPSSTHTYYVEAFDAAGNVSGPSSTASATTLASPDTLAPTTPAGLMANAISSSQIDLSWTASSDNVAVTGYRVYRAGVFLIAVGAVTTYTDNGLTASTMYTYYVEAFDAAGNVSGASSTASTTTLASVPTPGTPSISSVSGTISNNSGVTITGSSFGTKGHAGPMLYDDFDDASTVNIAGREPQLHQGHLVNYASWVQLDAGPGPIPQIVRDSSNPKSLSTNHARSAFTGDYWSLNLGVGLDYFTTGQEIYISFWYRYRKTGGTNYPRQTKAWIAYNASSLDRAYFSSAFDTCEGNGFRLHRTQGGFADTLLPLGANDVDNEWVRLESYLKQSAPNTSNGAWEQAIYTTNTPRRFTASLSNAQLRTTSEDWVTWEFGGAYFSMCNPGETGTIDIDDIYLDSTRARVELCNASTFSASTRCELQVPTAWTDTSITVTLKRGQLSTGSTAYLYVFNSTGNVNASGHAVTIVP